MLGVYINFVHDARAAISFYESVFDTVCTDLKTFGDMAEVLTSPVDEATKELVLNASLTIAGSKVMFSDTPPSNSIVMGNHMTLVIEQSDERILTNQFNRLAAEGTIVTPLCKTFWTEKYGYVIDKFGIGWQFSLGNE